MSVSPADVAALKVGTDGDWYNFAELYLRVLCRYVSIESGQHPALVLNLGVWRHQIPDEIAESALVQFDRNNAVHIPTNAGYMACLTALQRGFVLHTHLLVNGRSYFFEGCCFEQEGAAGELYFRGRYGS
jgi:hypothetical protein